MEDDKDYIKRLDFNVLIESSDLDAIHKQYAMSLSKESELSSQLDTVNGDLVRLKDRIKELDKEGNYAIEASGHAIKVMLQRLKSVSLQHKDAFNAVVPEKREEFFESIAFNLEPFIINLLVRARELGEVISKPSQNSSGTEYHFKIDINKWAGNDNNLTAVIVVEDNKVKTMYFNVKKKGS